MFYKRFVIGLLWMLFIGLSSILYVTYKYDPANIHNDTLTNKAVEIMLSGKHVSGLTNYDERRLKKTFIVKNDGNLKTCILGSSRAMSIRSKKEGVRNYSVSGAVLEDILGLWNVLDEHKSYNKIVIGIDAWIFNNNSGENRWKTLSKDYFKAVNKLGISKSFGNEVNLEKYWQLISLDYLKASIRVMRNKVKTNNIEGVADVNDDTVLLLTDGSIDYGRKRNSISIQEVNNEIKRYLKGDIYHLKGYDELDENRLKLFEVFIQKLKNEEKQVVLFLTPYHPRIYEYFQQNQRYRMVFETEKFIHKLGSANNVKIIGSFNPDICGVSEEDFMDAMHLKNKSIDKIFEKII